MSIPDETDKPLIGVKQDRDTGEWLVITPDPENPDANIEHYRVIGHRLAMYRANSLYKNLLAAKKVKDEKKAKINYGTKVTIDPNGPAGSYMLGPDGRLILISGGTGSQQLHSQGGSGGRGGLQKGMADKPKPPSLRPKLIALGIDALMLALEYAKRSQREVE